LSPSPQSMLFAYSNHSHHAVVDSLVAVAVDET